MDLPSPVIWTDKTADVVSRLLRLPPEWYGSEWPQAFAALGMIASANEEESYVWQDGVRAWVHRSEQGVAGMEITLYRRWYSDASYDTPEYDARYDDLEAHFGQAAGLAGSVLGPSQFQGDSDDPGCPEECRGYGSPLAHWRRDSLRMTLRADDAEGDDGPFLVSLIVEPPRDAAPETLATTDEPPAPAKKPWWRFW